MNIVSIPLKSERDLNAKEGFKNHGYLRAYRNNKLIHFWHLQFFIYYWNDLTYLSSEEVHEEK